MRVKRKGRNASGKRRQLNYSHNWISNNKEKEEKRKRRKRRKRKRKKCIQNSRI
jgi:hypothetical protein